MLADTPATFYVAVGAQDIWWRVQAPAKAIGARVVEMRDEEAQAIVTPDTPPFRWHIEPDDSFSYPDHQGAAIWTRPCSIRAKHALQMEALGIRTIAEVDDNHLSDQHLNVFMRVNRFGPRERLSHLKAMACHQAVIFSTRWLRDAYHKAFRKELGLVPELFVARNHVDLDEWPDPVPPRPDGRLRIGWMGSAQHARDIKLCYPALAWAREEGHEVVLMGNDVRDETGVTHPRALEACRAWRSVISTHIPWTEPGLYHRQALPLDIGLAPLERNMHTLGKSDIKWMEYAVSGAATVASNSTVYGEIEHGETGLLAGSPSEFLAQLIRLVQDDSLRERIVQNAQQHIRENRTVQKQGRREWMEAIG